MPIGPETEGAMTDGQQDDLGPVMAAARALAADFAVRYAADGTTLADLNAFFDEATTFRAVVERYGAWQRAMGIVDANALGSSFGARRRIEKAARKAYFGTGESSDD